jgi:hypothetical protein
MLIAWSLWLVEICQLEMNSRLGGDAVDADPSWEWSDAPARYLSSGLGVLSYSESDVSWLHSSRLFKATGMWNSDDDDDDDDNSNNNNKGPYYSLLARRKLRGFAFEWIKFINSGKLWLCCWFGAVDWLQACSFWLPLLLPWHEPEKS